MEKVKLPAETNYAEAYLTLQCQLNCAYCINELDGGSVDRTELTGEQWTDALNRIDFGKVPLTLGGGEPTLHPDFFDIVNGLNRETKVDLLTHLRLDADRFIRNVSPEKFSTSEIPFYHPIRVSFHPSQTDRQGTIVRARKLIDAGFNLGIFGIMHPESINDNMAMAFECNKADIPFYTKDFLGQYDGKVHGYFKYPQGVDGSARTVECRTKELLIGPNGDVYKCHRDLYKGEFAVGNILDEGFAPKYQFRHCGVYGQCNPCDVKAKTNRHLNGVDCQVEIRSPKDTPEMRIWQ